MFASTPDYVSPKRLAETHEPWRRAIDNPWVIDGTLVFVDDVQAHYQRAMEGGALIIRELETTDHGRLYSAEDLEGHRWMFMAR
jgi:uncharacterized glyoxalase superfamily protein PhnB